MKKRTSLRTVLLALGVLAPAAGAEAQGLVTPNTHWGSIMLPDPSSRTDWGLHFIGFTEYGKEVDEEGAYTFNPYNDIDETLGFNVLSWARTGYSELFPLNESSLQVRTTAFAGMVDDHITEFMQNDVAHWAKLRRRRLRRVPRELTDTEERTSIGPTRSTPIAGVSQEYFLRHDEQKRIGGRLVRVPSRFFVGGGYAISTINHEAFLHLGSNPFSLRGDGGPLCAWRALCVVSAGLGGMARGGVLFQSHHLDDLTGSYLNLQAVFDAELTIAGFSTSLAVAATQATGFFVERRTAADWQIIDELGGDPADVYEVKRPKHERFISIRLAMGGFSFEFLNDMIGAKDKGPTFGVSMSLETSRDGGLADQLRRYFGDER